MVGRICREAVNDARAVKAALEQQGFVVTLVENPNAAQLENAIKDFIAKRGLGAENRLLFYFAGHGHTQKKAYGADMGYIVPSDAPKPDIDQAGFLRKACSMENFNSYAREINAKHVLFLFDSCFSGSIFALARAVPAVITYKTSEPVREFITAGSADETVPDQSIFKQQFLSALNGEGDSNRDGYITGTELGEFLQTNVVNYTNESQHPQYGKIREPQLDKGDFVFIVPLTLPPKTKFDPSLYETEANRLAATKAQWENWQSEMSAGFQKAQSLDSNANLAAASKAQMWQEFLNSYAEDNPHSSEDETQRSAARERQNFWSAYQAPKMEPAGTALAPNGGDMVLIAAGSFMMGSDDGLDDEKPVHRVSVEAFYMDKYEVSVAKYKNFLDATNHPQPENWTEQLQAPNRPVVYVSWDDAKAYCEWLSQLPGKRVRLPTEAEWEYAARGGLEGKKYPWGDEINPNQANFYADNSRPYSWENAKKYLMNVGSYAANDYGLYDMAGNVWERCADWYDAKYYEKREGQNPQGPTSGLWCVVRGGSWFDDSGYVRCAVRIGSDPTYRGYNVGFRCVRDVR